MNKKWKQKTNGGLDVRIYATDGRGSHPIHGAVLLNEEWVPERWTEAGRRNKSGRSHDHDLVPDSQTYETWLQIQGGVVGFMSSPAIGAENNVHLRIDVDNKTVEVLDWRRSYE